ncbi:MAG TPA: serine/threonine-protein kinase [Polyangiaceae bacterium]|nr:serine/threonine-protein kinase [Polyangiaceae bacterium]
MELPIAVGQVVAQKYRVDRFIGQGGMGVVVAGFHLELDQPVAIKFLLAESGLQSEGAERFRREARAAAKIHSEHVARVFDIGLLDERVPYMVMELLHGNELEIEMERRGALPVGEAVGYLLQAIDAVAEAHSAGIVHRDLKPTNLFLAQRADGSRIVKVLDFGISKSLGTGRQSEVALTRTAAFVGSPLYMSPEQMRSARDVDARADVWALGAILYAMVTGQLPHPGNSLPEVCLAVMNNPPRPLRDFIASVPEALEAIVLKCLAKEPAQRYASVAELAEQLLPFAPEWHLVVERATRLLGGAAVGSYPASFVRSSHTPVVSSVTRQRISAPQMNDSTPPNATEAPWSKTGRKGAKRRRAPLLIAALFGVIAVLGVLVMTRRKPETPALAAVPTPSSAPSTPLAPVVSDVHAAVPAAASAELVKAGAEVSNVKPTASATPSVASAKAADRAAPRAIEPAPGAPRYTYFGGRR